MNRASLLLLSLVSLLSACIDVRAFEGRWRGGIVDEPAVRQGFGPEVKVSPLQLDDVTMQHVTARLTTSDDKYSDTELRLISKAAGDALASLSFDGDPLRSYLLFARSGPAAESSAFMVLSLYGDDHVELRVIRDNDLFGVFYLNREDEQQ